MHRKRNREERVKRENHQLNKPSLDRKSLLSIVALLIIFGYIVIKIGMDFTGSLFVQKPDRVNFVVYGEYPVLYSLGVRDAGSYAIELYPDIKTQIPGGYGYYRIGALGKLVELEKNPDLFLKTFSSVTSTFVDYYFYTNLNEVYYGGLKGEQGSTKPKIEDIIMMNSNASLFDKLFLLTVVNQTQSNQVYDITSLPYKKLQDDTIFLKDNFLEKFIGVFYNKTYRRENLNIQILYTNNEYYNTAEMISNMLNGNGIVVGDISKYNKKTQGCLVIESSSRSTETAKKIASFFDCRIQKGETDFYDILFVLGELEKKWEIE